jgi:alanyl-tRNA synthetase
VNVQKCLRTSDLDEVGDSFHLSLFEMLGNWSLGDYFKEESIPWSYEFLTSKEWLNIDEEKLSVTVFVGDEKIPRDTESARIWEGLGIPKDRIFYLPRKDNWWGPIGSTGPCGPDTEIFYDTGMEPCGSVCKPGCSCGKYNEIWNNVFMEYNRTPDGEYELLEQKNVDTGMGVERTVAVLQGKDNVYETETFAPLVNGIKELTGIEVISENQIRSVRIICDHSRAATFLLAEGIVPLNVEQGYVLRRVIRGAIRHGKLLGIEEEFLSVLSRIIIGKYVEDYPHLKSNEDFIVTELEKEYKKFNNTLAKGLNRFNRIARNKEKIDGKDAFLLYQSFGFPIEITKELGKENGILVDVDGFYKEFEKHQKVSRAGADKRFGSGSNITQKRLRFDFNFDRKLTDQEKKEVEAMVNRWINEALPVKRIETTLDEAIRMGSQAVFEQKYGEKVSVYSIGDFSTELCNGPHVENTGELGRFKIIKEEGISAGVRRIRAVLE